MCVDPLHKQQVFVNQETHEMLTEDAIRYTLYIQEKF